MLDQLRKFSSSIYAKFFLLIIIIPFITWGMGPIFQKGSKNTIIEIGKDKISTAEFIDYMNNYVSSEEKQDVNSVNKILPRFIGEKLISEEIKNLNITISDNSLSKIIKNEKIFRKGKKFSRIEYEKYLVKNGLNTISLENLIREREKRKQLFNFIGGGVIPSKFLVNLAYDRVNQERNIQLINLNDVFKKKINFSENQIKSYFDQNKDMYKDTYKSAKFINLNPKNLTGDSEFNNLFFEKIDEIDDLIVNGTNIDYILKKFNLESVNFVTFNESGLDRNLKKIDSLPGELIKNVFNINKLESAVLIEHKDKYYVIEVTKTENIQRELNDETVKKKVILNLEKGAKRKFLVEIIDKINKNNFIKYDFDKLSKDENIVIKKVKLVSQNDERILKKELVDQVYKYPEKRVIIVTDIGLTENFLIYIDNIENMNIDENNEDYRKYFDLSESKMKKSLYDTYDLYLNDKYKVSINSNALDSVKNNLQ